MKISLSVVTLLLVLISCSHEGKKSVNVFDNLTDINSDKDLMKGLSEIFEGKRIVLLGEQSHGDRTSFMAKTELIKYLIEKEGFNKLFFESSRYNLDSCNKFIENGGSLSSYMDNNLLSIWSRPNCNQTLFRYLEQAQISILGIDIQFAGKLRSKGLKEKVVKESVIDANEIEIFKKGMDYLGNSLVNDTLYSVTDEEWFIFKSIVANRLSNNFINRLVAFKDGIRNGKPYTELFSFRDSLMFENLKEQLNNGDKAIIWGASAHLVRNIEEIEVLENEWSYSGFNTLGGYIYENFSNDEFISIAFTGGKGQYLDYFEEKKCDIELKDSTNIETELLKENYEHALIDISTEYDSVRISQMLGSYSNFRANWSRHFDYLFYSKLLEAADYNN